MEIDYPSIGDHIKSSHDYILDSEGNNKYSLLLLNGNIFDENNYPQLALKLGTTTLETRESGDVRVPYKIVGDLQ